MRTRSIDISIETERVLVIRKRTSSSRAWCADCGEQVIWATPEDGGTIASVDPATINHWAREHKLHTRESFGGDQTICLKSLFSLSLMNHVSQWRDDLSNLQTLPLRQARAEEEDCGLDYSSEDFLPIQPLPDRQVISRKRGSSDKTLVKKGWNLNQTAFDHLLACLDQDPERAGEKYALLHQKLLKFFEARGCASATDFADETMDRVARKLEEGLRIQDDGLTAYCYGVARNIFREHGVDLERNAISIEALPAPQHPRAEDDHTAGSQSEQEQEGWLDRLELCLAKLPAESQRLIIEYYQGEGQKKIDHRKKLASQMGITLNALAIRVHRIREGLERDLLEHSQEAFRCKREPFLQA